jgi:hypothetical protein
MQEVESEMTCLVGHMGLSQSVRRGLEEIVALPPTLPEPMKVRVGGEWHCPADGELVVEDHGLMQCSVCGRYLTPSIIYGVVEFHFHTRR